MAKLLLVEDDNNLREIYEARLQAEGYTIVSARDGEEALVVAKAEKPNLIIADVMMPKISGFEMLDIMRNTDGLKDVRVIMLTALGQSDDQQRADKLGADRYLVKSQVTLEDIVKVAHELLGDGGGVAVPAATNDTPATADAPSPTTATTTIPVASEPDSAPASDSTQSTVQEETAVEARIEDFVAGATEEPTALTPAEPAPAEAVTPAPADAVTPTPETTTATADDKLMAEAVDNLVANAPAPPTETESEEAAVAPAVDEPPLTVDEDSGGAGTKKIIEPLSSKPKADLDALLAAEEAKEVQANTTVSVPAPAVSKPAPTDDEPVDPNSVAL
ncbi:hypothetical protein COY17_02400 [Candidatus Saccharibacteria bacterium CG_4_10_14_0_2_um_filter_52_9]|nr:MAG: hypothetical protein COY17_02400 [Candidatus Saccharibacteria bacterium CG_4_10_14_0_2_um_filter_52_9]